MAEPLASIMVGDGSLALIGPGGPLLISREQLALMTEFLVALQDICDPEADNEENDLEDSFALSWYASGDKGAGCDIADAGGPGWIERNNHTRRPYGSSDPSTIGAHEDAEDDDPAEESEPLEHNGDEVDGNASEDDFMQHEGSGPGCILSDPDRAVDDDACDEPFQDLEPEEGM